MSGRILAPAHARLNLFANINYCLPLKADVRVSALDLARQLTRVRRRSKYAQHKMLYKQFSLILMMCNSL
jgi:hypothetical protein